MSFLPQSANSTSIKCTCRSNPARRLRFQCFSSSDRASTRVPLQNQRAGCRAANSEHRNTDQEHCVLSRRQSLLLVVAAAAASLSEPAVAQPPPAAKTEGITTVVPVSAVKELAPSERQVYKLNKRIQGQNRLREDFPVFVREGFNVKIIADNYSTTPEGLIYSVLQEGKGTPGKSGQQVVFEYVGYNESGTMIDSSYRQGKPAEATLGIGGVIPGFEIALKSMPPGSKWRVIIPPELGPPVGPSTFFSAKQCEVFDINVLDIKNCSRKPMLMFSQLVCE